MGNSKGSTRTSKPAKKTKSTGQFTTGTIEVKKLDPTAKPLTKAYPGDACYDLYAIETKQIPGLNSAAVRTGIAVAIPPGYFGKIYDRSGNALNGNFLVTAGVIDSGYRGEIQVVLFNKKDYPHYVAAGDKIAQIAIHQIHPFEIKEVPDFSTNTERNEKGFGSSDK
jgi:deoxyuridine 5'-triphosphate nucleotidohydrolase